MCVSLLTHATRPIHPHKGLLMPLLSILVSDPQGHSNKHMHNCKMYIKSYVLIINLVRWWLKDIEEHVFKLSYGKGGYFPLFIREAISNNLFLIASCFLGGCFVVLLVCFLKKSFFRNVFSNQRDVHLPCPSLEPPHPHPFHHRIDSTSMTLNCFVTSDKKQRIAYV